MKFAFSVFLKVITVVFQFATFYFLVGSLEKPEFALYSTVAATSVLFVHFVAPGFTNLIVQYGSRGELQVASDVFSGALLIATFSSFFFAGLVLILVRPLVGEVGIIYVIVFILSELLISRIFDLTGSFWHFKNISIFFLFQLLFVLSRLVVVVINSFLIDGGAEILFFLLFASGAIIVLAQWFWLRLGIDFAFIGWHRLGMYLKQGLPFALNISCKNINTSADKPIFVKYGISPVIIADYALAFRLVYIVFMPFHTVMMILVPKFFREGAESDARTMFIENMLYFLVGFLGTIVAGICLFFGANYFMGLFGESYQSAVVYLEIMSAFPLFLFVNMFLSELVTGSGGNISRFKMQLLSATTFISVCLIAIPMYGVKGAALAFYAAEVVMMFCLFIFVFFRGRINAH